jgi:predicted secreted protein
MATQAIAGYKGTLRISTDGGTTFLNVAEIKDVEINYNSDSIDATSHDSAGSKEFIYGLSEWGLTAGALYVDGDAQQVTLFDAIANKTILDVELRPAGATSGKKQYKGKVLITNWKEASPNADAAMLNVEMKGTAALTRSNQP